MERYKKLFKNLNYKKSGALVPFVTIGDPNQTDFMHIIDTLITSGSDALELGIPFSDPLSDGPIIQKSMQRAFQAGINFAHCFTIIQNIRNKYPNIPIGLLIYANLVFKNGLKNFYSRCSTLDIDSVLIPDVPIEEISPFYKIAMQNKIAQIFICPPNATNALIQSIISLGHGYIYLLSRPGVTGYANNNHIMTSNYNVLNKIIQYINLQKKQLPILQGFGIHTPNQAKQSLLLGTSGIILGSVIAEIIEQNIIDTNKLLKQLHKLVYEMKTAMYL